MITSLKPNEVFVFGSNEFGFHGAGAAGLACRGDPRNTWRQDQWFCKALNTPIGSPERIGKWAILGQARGLQVGHEGSSYAIVTIKKPGLKCSTPITEIRDELVTLFEFAENSSGLRFLMTPIGAGLAGYDNQTMVQVFDAARVMYGGIPKNLVLEKDDYLYGVCWNMYR